MILLNNYHCPVCHVTAADALIDFPPAEGFKANLLMQLEDEQSYTLQHVMDILCEPTLHTETI